MNTRKFTYSFRNRCYIKIIFMAKTNHKQKEFKIQMLWQEKA